MYLSCEKGNGDVFKDFLVTKLSVKVFRRSAIERMDELSKICDCTLAVNSTAEYSAAT